MSTDVGRIVEEIHRLPHWRTIQCTCGNDVRIHALQIHALCRSCGQTIKCRAFGGLGTELEDVIDAVLEWASVGEDFAAVMQRHEQIVADPQERQ
jgi:hypothetical protein